ncbi:tail fiber domain-containing protein [Longibaculum muris]|uniref:tail fiber domain-containing protein n=1 Tax=Longibaculum muris TaxID=1796628 RepID=UPI003AB309D1
MNVHKLRMDTSGNVEDISFVLAKKNGDKLGNITNVDNIVAKHSMKEASEFTFAAHKKIGNSIIKCWNDIKDFKLVWIPEWDMWYEITVEVNEKDENIKNVSGKTLGEAELSQIMLYGIEINTETDIAREDYKIPTTFYNPDHPEASLMDRLLTDKAPHYKVKHIDKSLMNLQRTFTFDDTSIYDALQEISEELDCLFIFGCGSDENGKPERTISVYDLEANCIDCGNRDTFVHKCPKCGSTNIILGYGEYTNVFISRDNLADEITYSVDTDSVKNCMKLEAGDDLMTAAIRSCNPNGTDYIYYFPDAMREEMSPELQEKLKSYDALYEKYQSDYNFAINDSFVTNYNSLVNKYKTYEESLKDTEIKNPIVGYPKLMRIYFDTIDMVQLLRNKLMPPVDKPDNNAKSQGEYLMANLPSSASTTSLKNLSVSTADNIMVMLAQSIVKGVFKVTVTNTTLSNNVWKGKFNLENYADKDDKFTSQFISISINENYESYVKQRIDSILARSDENYYDIVGLFKQDMTVFKSQLKKYCLNTLQIFQKCCQSCIDMMVQQGISSNSTSSIYGINTKVLYENVYIPYYNKMNAIQDEIKVREDELYTVEGKYNNQNQLVQDGVQIEIERIITEVQDALNFKNYIGIDLYKEFSSFIRMDKFSNDNYISDGLNNTDLMKNAIEFITVATKELFKSASLQHSITGTIKNFLRMKEFEPVTNNFKNGNWICVGIDDKVYQLRIIEYEIDFSDTQNISVTFSDVVSTPDGMTDLESILSNSSKMATSYSGVTRQSTINTNFKNKMNEMIAKGLSMTNTKIVSNADNQDITWDEHGLLCREYDDIISDYTDSQLKIINHGIYITDDNWKTARAGIGNFIYYDPKDKTYKESYGVIADTLVSNLILTSEVGIYNEEKSIEMAKDGIIVTTNTMNKNVFTIRKEITDDEGNVTYERQLYIDDNGNIRLAGNASIAWDSITGTENVVVKDTLNEFMATVKEQIDGKIDTFRQSDDPSVNWTDEEKKSHENDLWYDTTNNVVKMWNGSSWDDFTGDVPESVWNEINGKAQIFTDTPKTPYNKGDLWFVGSSGDILTCVTARKESEQYNSSDWTKQNKYTDDTVANGVKQDLLNLSNVLGYNGTKITGTYIYSPHIIGGELSIGDSSGVHASISTTGKLTATEVDISGKINATDGSFSGTLNAAKGTFMGTLSAASGSFTGTLSGATGNFTGDIVATSIYAQNDYRIYASGKDKYIKAIWCGDNWEPTDGIADLYMGNQEKSWLEFIDYTSSTIQFTRRTSIISQYATTAKTNRSSVSCVTDQDTTYVQLFTIRNDVPAEVRLQIANDSGLCFIPGDVNDSALTYDETIKLGTKSHKWMQVWTKNLYANGDTIRFSGISAKSSTRYLVIDSSGNVGYRDGNGGGGELVQEYTAGVGIKIVNNKISLTGTSKDNYRYVRNPIDGTLHMSNGCGWDLVNTDNKEVTGIYCNGSNEVIISEKDYDTILRGSSIQLGNSNTIVKIPYLPNYTSASKYLVDDGNGNIGWKTISSSGGSLTGGLTIKLNGTSKISSWKGASDVSVNITASSIGAATSNHSHDMSSYATTSWVKGAFGDTLSISGSTLYLKNYNGFQLSSVTLPTSSGGSSTPSEAIASDGTTRPIVTSGTAGSNTYTAWIGTYYESSSYVLKVNGKWSSSSWETHGFKSNYSDIRLKTNISNSNRKALDIINSIKIRQFDWIRSGEHQDIGFIADELETLDKHFAFGGGYEEDGSMNIKSVDSLYLQGYEVKAIQELSQENQKLKNTIFSLQGEIAIIKQKLEELA